MTFSSTGHVNHTEYEAALAAIELQIGATQIFISHDAISKILRVLPQTTLEAELQRRSGKKEAG